MLILFRWIKTKKIIWHWNKRHTPLKRTHGTYSFGGVRSCGLMMKKIKWPSPSWVLAHRWTSSNKGLVMPLLSMHCKGVCYVKKLLLNSTIMWVNFYFHRFTCFVTFGSFGSVSMLSMQATTGTVSAPTSIFSSRQAVMIPASHSFSPCWQAMVNWSVI